MQFICSDLHIKNCTRKLRVMVVFIVLLNLLVKLDNCLYSCIVLLNKKKVHAEPNTATTKLSADA